MGLRVAQWFDIDLATKKSEFKARLAHGYRSVLRLIYRMRPLMQKQLKVCPSFSQWLQKKRKINLFHILIIKIQAWPIRTFAGFMTWIFQQTNCNQHTKFKSNLFWVCYLLLQTWPITQAGKKNPINYLSFSVFARPYVF